MTPSLLDTHLLLWSTYRTHRLSPAARTVLRERADALCFSSVSLVELAIKQQTGKLDFSLDLAELRATLASMGMQEVPLTGDHALAMVMLPSIHRDPFDRMLLAQALSAGLELVTADKVLSKYPARIRYVG